MKVGLQLLTLSTLLVLMACGNEQAGRVAAPVLSSAEGVAIEGYDPVAYFTNGEATPGQQQHAVVWNDAQWWFATAENKAAFLASPEAYAPAYGGWCAYCVAEGYAAETDPVNGWTIHEGRLYLNWDAKVMAEWRAAKASLIETSESNWPGIETQLSEGSAEVYWH